eukprot:TRINITY_DN14547_c0_g1_i2.p1 TRINITY_DN14547_c0_g1~~TRINITY_DN14547_c0_g1_i2.p1  ORF type:complete len:408 (+),score=99.05 TRINITY_DN14547_c0_g1_i2:102-1226(+)
MASSRGLQPRWRSSCRSRGRQRRPAALAAFCSWALAGLQRTACDDPVFEARHRDIDFASCSEHLRSHDWNQNCSVEEWNGNFVLTSRCAKFRQELAAEAAATGKRPAALSGVHVPTLIVPTLAEDLKEQAPYYFILPVWDMVVSNRVKLFGSYDPQELDILMKLTPPGGAFVDIGANIGSVTVPMAAHVGREGVVYSFEPFRQIFQYLNANVAANGLANVWAFQNGLSDGETPTRLMVPAPTLEAVQNAGMYAVFQGGDTRPNTQTSQTRERMERVEVRTLDSFDLERADVIKIDVEGHAPRVLAGALELLRRFQPILWFEDGAAEPPAVLSSPGLSYWCTKFDTSTTTEDQFICVPRERHAEVQEKLNSIGGE